MSDRRGRLGFDAPSGGERSFLIAIHAIQSLAQLAQLVTYSRSSFAQHPAVASGPQDLECAGDRDRRSRVIRVPATALRARRRVQLGLEGTASTLANHPQGDLAVFFVEREESDLLHPKPCDRPTPVITSPALSPMRSAGSRATLRQRARLTILESEVVAETAFKVSTRTPSRPRPMPRNITWGSGAGNTSSRPCAWPEDPVARNVELLSVSKSRVISSPEFRPPAEPRAAAFTVADDGQAHVLTDIAPRTTFDRSSACGTVRELTLTITRPSRRRPAPPDYHSRRG